jgi:hypothetical protein
MHGEKLFVFVHDSGPDSPELFHGTLDSQKESEVLAKGSNVTSRLNRTPKDGQSLVFVVLEEFDLVNLPDSESLFDSRNSGWHLKNRTSQKTHGLDQCFSRLDLRMHSQNTNVFLTGSLLGLGQSCSPVEASDQTASDLGIQGTRVTSLLDLENSLDPGDDFMGRGICWFVEVDI